MLIMADATSKHCRKLVQSQQTIIEEQQQEIEQLKLYNIDSNNQINQLQQENQQLKNEIAIIKGHLGLWSNQHVAIYLI